MNYKTHIFLLVSTLLLSTLGFYLLAHGAIYSETELRTAEPSLWFKSEMVLGSVLIWPVSTFGWIFHLLFNKTVIIPFPITVFLLISGNYALFFSFTNLIENHKNTDPVSSEDDETPL